MMRTITAKALVSCATAVLLGANAWPAVAGTPVEERITCPIGGERFDFTSTASYSTYGARPDGKPYGSWTFPLPLPECPSNGLVLYRDFDADEKPRLAALIASPDYAALREETPYYRAQWLASRMDAGGSDEGIWLLQRAIWQADGDPARKQRYQEEFVARTAGIAPDPANVDSLFMRLYVANAYRELRRFDEALSVLDSIQASPPPARSVTADFDVEQDRESRNYLARSILLMRAEIARGETSAEPLRMIPQQEAAAACATALEDGLTMIDPYCASPALADQVKDMRSIMRQRGK